MSKEMLNALDALEAEKGISKEIVIDALEAALVSAYKRHYGQAQNVEVEFDQKKGKIHVYAVKEVTEEVIVHVQIPVSVYHVTQVNTAFPDFLVAHVAQVHAVAKLVQLGWILGSGNTARGEAVAVARHVGMPVDLEGEVGSSSQTDRSGLEIAGRGVQIDGLHVRQIGGRGNRQLV